MALFDYFFKVCAWCYLVSLIWMYLYVLKIDKKTSVTPVNICSNYAKQTKKIKGRVGILYYINQLAGMLAILSIIVPFVMSILSKSSCSLTASL